VSIIVKTAALEHAVAVNAGFRFDWPPRLCATMSKRADQVEVVDDH